MEFIYKLDIEDYIEFNKYHIQSSKQFKKSMLIGRLMIAIIFGMFFLIGLFPVNIITVVIILIASLIWFLFYPKLMKRGVVSNEKKLVDSPENFNLICEHRIIIDDQGITDITEEASFRISWNGIVKLGEISSHYFIFNSTFSALIIPKDKIDCDLKE